MPKDGRVNSLSFDQATVSPCSHGLKISDCDYYDSSFSHVGDENKWEEARCPICMEHPHNAVLLVCSSRGKGCRPFICDTSYRHSNCFDQFRKSATVSPLLDHQLDLICPLCRGAITGWNVVPPARRFMDSKTRSCSLETCSFSGNYTELRKHARLEHPFSRPSEASPTRQSSWAAMERRRDIEDALAHDDSDIDYEWGVESFLSDGSFFDFPSGMSDIEEDPLTDQTYFGISLSFISICPSSSEEEEIMDSGSWRRSRDRLQGSMLPTNSSSTLNNQAENTLPSIHLHTGNGANDPRSTLGHTLPSFLHIGNGTNFLTSASGFHVGNGLSLSRSTSSYHVEDDLVNIQLRPRHSDRRENAPTRSRYNWLNDSSISRTRSRYNWSNDSSISRTRSRYNWSNVSNISSSRSINHRENAPTSLLRTRSSYRRERTQLSSMSRPSYYNRRVPATRRNLPGLSRLPNSRYYRGEATLTFQQSSTRRIPNSSRQSRSRYNQLGTGRIPNSSRRPSLRYDGHIEHNSGNSA